MPTMKATISSGPKAGQIGAEGLKHNPDQVKKPTEDKTEKPNANPA